MARKAKTARKPWWFYLGATLLLAGLAAIGWYWWDLQSWRPNEAIYPDQGLQVSDANGLVGFETARALGAKFAYLSASMGADGKDARFARNLAAARRAGLQVGAVHTFDPCVPADRQSANFVTVVPRDKDLLPPAIALDATAESCEPKVSDASVESELMTFINQVEMHSGKRAILKLSENFETRYYIGGMIDRDLWLVRDRYDPDYSLRPWLLWSANGALQSEISAEPVEWIVVQP